MGELMASLFGKQWMTEEPWGLEPCPVHGTGQGGLVPASLAVSWGKRPDFSRLRLDLDRKQTSFYVWWMQLCLMMGVAFFLPIFLILKKLLFCLKSTAIFTGCVCCWLCALQSSRDLNLWYFSSKLWFWLVPAAGHIIWAHQTPTVVF